MIKKRHRVPKEIKKEILLKVKTEGLTVAKASEQYGISTVSIYKWLSDGVSANPTWRELNKVKKENKMLLELVGELTMKLSTSKKKK